MNEAKQMHDDLLNTLLPIIPRTTYQDIRRLSTLASAIVGLSPFAHGTPLSLGLCDPEPCTVRRQPGATLLPLAASSWDCSLRLVSACIASCSG